MTKILEKTFHQKDLTLSKQLVIRKKIDYRYFRMKPSKRNNIDFRIFLPLKTLFQRIYFEDVLIPAAEREQDVFDTILKEIKNYKPRTEANIEDKKPVYKNDY